MALLHDTKTAWSSRYRHIFTLFLISALVVVAGYSYIRQQKRFLMDEKRSELTTIADLKVSQIVQWRKERLIEATSIHSNAMMSHRIKDYLNGVDSSRALEEFRAWMTSLHDLAGYRKVILYSADGDVITAVSDEKRPSDAHYRDQVATAVEKQEIIFSDFHRDDATGVIDIDLVIPIMNPDGNRSRCIAVLALDIDPHTFLYPLIQSWPTASASAETLLVERKGNEVLFLNELRHRKQTALTFRRPITQKNMPATRAALGQEGIFEGIDYRGAEVLSAIRTVPGSPWVMIAKIDAAEIFAPIGGRIWFVAAICIMLIIALVLGVSLWGLSRKQGYLHKLYETELRFNSELKKAELSLLEAQNQLEQRVSERTRELSGANNKLRQEIAERKQVEQLLYDAKKMESIGQLAGGVAHEVRNPLNAILTITEALFREKEIENNPEYEPYIQHIRTQVNRLAQLMNDLLDLGKPIPASSLQPVPLYELCRETLALWKSSSMANNRQAFLTFDQNTETCLVLAESIKLQQVIFNLLENAGHHSSNGSTILLQLSSVDPHHPSPDMAIVRLIDQGSGIPDDKIARVFDPFYSNRKGGTGLGLALVKHFIENMGGSVCIWNNDPPPGCTAEVRILLADKEN